MRSVTVAKALIADADADVLLLRRSKSHPTLALQPDFPGGEVEAGEEIAQALAREIAEETGLAIASKDLHLIFAGTEVQPNGSYTRLLFVAKIPTIKPPINLSWEHDSSTWIRPENLPDVESQFNSFAKHALAHIREHGLLEVHDDV